jgi:predicted nuclease of restriction endonuclease-like (RecB) superfamily
MLNKALVSYTWLTHIMLINTVKATAARLFYLQRAVEYKWKYQQLEQAISTGQYEREGNGQDSYIIRLDL